MAFLIGGANSAADTGYEVANSCRFNDGDSASMLKAASTGDRRQVTISAWVKRGVLGTEQQIWAFRRTSSYVFGIFFNGSNDKIEITDYQPSAYTMRLITTAQYRDCAAWYHICLAVDTEQGTAANRAKLYVNGVQVTAFDTESYPSQNTDLYVNVSGENHYIGTEQSGRYADMYMAEVVFIDGTQNAVTSFGEFNSDSPTIWQPIDVSGLTFGTNGFYLDFEDSANLGNDANGGTDFTESNLAATDQSIDSPTNNFCTLNPLLKGSYITLSEGNLVETGNTATDAGNVACTFPMPGGGKWYFELKITAVSGSYPKIAVFHDFESVPQGTYNGGSGGSNMHPSGASGNAVSTTVQYGSTTLENPTSNLTITAPANGDTIQFALDMDNGAIYVGVNGTFLNSGDPTSGASKTGKVADLTVTNQIMPMVSDYNGGATSWNFGSPNHSISSGNADDNGYGNFEYDVPTGYFALCSKNLGSDGG